MTLEKLDCGKEPFPLSGDLQHIMLDITKCIDSLHFKDPRCAVLYSPDHLSGDEQPLSMVLFFPTPLIV